MVRRILSEKQRRFIAEYLSNGQNGEKAVIAAGYDVKNGASARTVASVNLTKVNIRSEIERELQVVDVGPKRFARVLSEALGAESKMIIGPGVVEKSPDHGTRLKALDQAAKLLDAYPHPATSTHEHKHLHVQTSEPIEVMRFRVIHGRSPSPRELAELQGQVIEAEVCESYRDSADNQPESVSQSDRNDAKG